MGFLERGIKGDETDTSADLEEQYERLFPKIGRDFVYREDLEGLLTKIIQILDPTGVFGLSLDDSAAKSKAHEYKRVLDKGKDGTKIYNDLIKLDEDE
jgi:hypothetical protein